MFYYFRKLSLIYLGLLKNNLQLLSSFQTLTITEHHVLVSTVTHLRNNLLFIIRLQLQHLNINYVLF